MTTPIERLEKYSEQLQARLERQTAAITAAEQAGRAAGPAAGRAARIAVELVGIVRTIDEVRTIAGNYEIRQRKEG